MATILKIAEWYLIVFLRLQFWFLTWFLSGCDNLAIFTHNLKIWKDLNEILFRNRLKHHLHERKYHVQWRFLDELPFSLDWWSFYQFLNKMSIHWFQTFHIMLTTGLFIKSWRKICLLIEIWSVKEYQVTNWWFSGRLQKSPFCNLCFWTQLLCQSFWYAKWLQFSLKPVSKYWYGIELSIHVSFIYFHWPGVELSGKDWRATFFFWVVYF